jgi:hypothetical protein
MVLPLKSDRGKCVIPVLNRRRRTMVQFDWGGGGGQHIVLGGFGTGLWRQRRIFFPPSRDVETHLSVVRLSSFSQYDTMVEQDLTDRRGLIVSVYAPLRE